MGHNTGTQPPQKPRLRYPESHQRNLQRLLPISKRTQAQIRRKLLVDHKHRPECATRHSFHLKTNQAVTPVLRLKEIE